MPPTPAAESLAQAAITRTPATATVTTTNLPLAYMRASLIPLVVALHSTLAYFPFGPAARGSLLDPPRLWLFIPIVDTHQWAPMKLLFSWLDTFLMALLFFTSGLFVWKSLERKGTAVYFKDRLLRMGVPFLVFLLLSPLIYYPSYLQSTPPPFTKKPGFWHEWLGLHSWPGGHVWFLWVLLLFDCLVIGIFQLAPDAFVALGRRIARHAAVAIVACLILISALTHIPLSLHYGRLSWVGWGLFYFQANTLLHYLGYFLLGAALGASGEKSFLSPDSPFAAHWRQWLLASVLGFGLLTAMNFLAHHLYSPVQLWSALVAAAFTISCALNSFACLAFFLHFVKKRHPLLDSLFACSYGIYLVHLSLVSWAQYSVLALPAPAWLKFGLVWSAATLASWGLTLLLRRSRLVRRFI